MIQIEYSQKKLGNEDIRNHSMFHAEVKLSISTIYHFSARNIGPIVSDFIEDFLANINQYPLHMKLENDEINYDEIVNLLTTNQMSYIEILRNSDYCCFSIIIQNEGEFRTIYPYFVVGATCNLTAMYTMPHDFLWRQPLNEADMNTLFMADFQNAGETLIALGFDGDGVEIWTTDEDLAANDFNISILGDKYTLISE